MKLEAKIYVFGHIRDSHIYKSDTSKADLGGIFLVLIMH